MAPVGPVAPVSPVSPVAPVGPVAPVAPVGPVGPCTLNAIVVTMCDCVLSRMCSNAVGVPDCDCAYTLTSMRLFTDASVEVGTYRSYSYSATVVLLTGVPLA